MEIIASDTFGRPVKLTYQKIYQVLINPCEGVAHVFAHDPKLICISRMKEGKEWEIAVEESWDSDPESEDKMLRLPTIYYVTFKDEDIDAAIKLFLNLIKFPRKEYEAAMRRKIGKYIIFPSSSDTQIYMDETLRRNTKRGSGRRRQGSVATKGKKVNRNR
jgi:hypothetical protein